MAHARGTPEDLCPARCTEAHGEYWKDPRVTFRQVGEYVKEHDPYADEEDDDQNHYLPRWHCLVRP